MTAISLEAFGFGWVLGCSTASNPELKSSSPKIDNFILPGDLAARGVDNESDVAVFYSVEHVRAAFAQFEHPGHGNRRISKNTGGTTGRDDAKPKLYELAHNWNDCLFIGVLDANEY